MIRTRSSFLRNMIYLLAFTLMTSISDAQIMYRVTKSTSTTLNNGQDVFISGGCFPLISSEESGAILKLKFGGYTFYVPRSSCSLVPDSEISAANTQYEKNYANYLPRIREYEEDQARKRASTPSAPAPVPAPQPSNVTIEPLYTWDVTVYVGRKYWATKDKYEVYTNLKTEVQAKTRSEAERIAADRSYTTQSTFIGASIKVEPAGTEGAKFRVYNCEATRQ